MADFLDTGCGGPGVRINDDGSYEIEGVGIPVRPLPPHVMDWTDLLNQAAGKYQLDANFLAGIMSLESGGNPNAKSPAPAYGLMQVTPSTGKGLAGRTLSESELFDPALSVDLGSKYIRQLWDRYGGNPVKVAFGYNAGGAYCGPGHVRLSDGTWGACTPNKYNLRADCHGVGQPTVDYAEIVLGYANGALATRQFGASMNWSRLDQQLGPKSYAGEIFATLSLLGLGLVIYRARS